MQTTNLKIWLAISIALLVVLPGSVWADGTYSGGTGEPSDPYLISTAADMNEIGIHTEDWDNCFLLTADINLIDYNGTSFNIIGYWIDYSDNHPFTGVFDGNGHTISNFTYASPTQNHTGLFGYLGTGGEIKDLGLEGIDIITDSFYVAGLVAWNVFGTITNCYVTGSVRGQGYVGGLVGRNCGIINNCYSTCSMWGEDDVGSLVGWNDFGMITNCYATGDVTGENRVGGLVGPNWGHISNCYAASSIIGKENTIGGLVGENEVGGMITQCYSTSSVEAWSQSEEVGGLAGENESTITNCYSMGSVSGDYYVGGVVGYNDDDSMVAHCYSTGIVVGVNDVGGVVGYNDSGADILASLWDTQSTNQADGVGFDEGGGTVEVYGKTTAQMQTEITFTDYGWDFVGETINGPNDIWRMCVDGLNYPKLWWEFVTGDFVCPDGVDFTDFAVVSLAWLSDNTPTVNWNPECDISEPPDGIIDELDLAVFTDNWLTGK